MRAYKAITSSVQGRSREASRRAGRGAARRWTAPAAIEAAGWFA